jgi:hypothetical protein
MPSPVSTASNANVTDYDDKAPSFNEGPEAVAPDLIQLVHESLIVLNITELVRVIVVLF